MKDITATSNKILEINLSREKRRKFAASEVDRRLFPGGGAWAYDTCANACGRAPTPWNDPLRWSECRTNIAGCADMSATASPRAERRKSRAFKLRPIACPFYRLGHDQHPS